MFEHGGCNVASHRAGPGLAEGEGLGRKTVGEEKKHGMALETGKGKSFGGNDKWVQLLVLFHSHEGNGSLHGSRATDMSH